MAASADQSGIRGNMNLHIFSSNFINGNGLFISKFLGLQQLLGFLWRRAGHGKSKEEKKVTTDNNTLVQTTDQMNREKKDGGEKQRETSWRSSLTKQE